MVISRLEIPFPLLGSGSSLILIRHKHSIAKEWKKAKRKLNHWEYNSCLICEEEIYCKLIDRSNHTCWNHIIFIIHSFVLSVVDAKSLISSKCTGESFAQFKIWLLLLCLSFNVNIMIKIVKFSFAEIFQFNYCSSPVYVSLLLRF